MELDTDPPQGDRKGDTPAAIASKEAQPGGVDDDAPPLAVILLGVFTGGWLLRAGALVERGPADAGGIVPAAEIGATALGLLTVALLFAPCAPRLARRMGSLLAGVAIGIASTLLGPVSGAPTLPFSSQPLAESTVGRFQAVGAWLLPLVLISWLLARRGSERGAEGPGRARSDRSSPLGPAFFAAFLLGAGLALSCLGSLRIVGRLGLGTAGDDAVFLASLAGIAALGAWAFGPLARSSRGTQLVGWVTAVAMGLAVPSVLAAITSPRGFKALCARFGADASLAGTLTVDAAVGLTGLAIPGLALGIVLGSTRGRHQFLGLVLGGALSLLLVGLALPEAVLQPGPGGSTPGESFHAGLLPVHGSLLGAVGLVVAFISQRRGRWRALATLVLTAMASRLPVTRIVVLDPWERFPRTVLADFETPTGQFLVERSANGVLRATLENVPITPRGGRTDLDRARVRAALELLPAAAGERSVLLVGQLTPARLAELEAGGVTRIDRTAAWFREMLILEGLLFQGPHGIAGEPLSPADAARAVDAGEYDLVLGFGPGGAPLRAGDDGASTPVVLWPALDAPTADMDAGFGIVASDGVRSFAYGFTNQMGKGNVRGRLDRATAPTALAWLRTRPDDRERLAWSGAAERIAAAPIPTRMGKALALHAAAQTMGSPFESADERVVLVPEALALWREQAAANPEPSPLERGIVEGIGDVIRAQGQVPLAFSFLGPIAAARFPWPRLEWTLAWADQQELEFDAAVARIDRLLGDPDRIPGGLTTIRVHAGALVDAGRAAEAADALRPLVGALGDDRALKIQFADALVAAGNPEGRRIAAELLRDTPNDPVLFGLAQGVRGMLTLDPSRGAEAAPDPSPEGRSEMEPEPDAAKEPAKDSTGAAPGSR